MADIWRVFNPLMSGCHIMDDDPVIFGREYFAGESHILCAAIAVRGNSCHGIRCRLFHQTNHTEGDHTVAIFKHSHGIINHNPISAITVGLAAVYSVDIALGIHIGIFPIQLCICVVVDERKLAAGVYQTIMLFALLKDSHAILRVIGGVLTSLRETVLAEEQRDFGSFAGGDYPRTSAHGVMTVDAFSVCPNQIANGYSSVPDSRQPLPVGLNLAPVDGGHSDLFHYITPPR